jgi:hypothetical protein
LKIKTIIFIFMILTLLSFQASAGCGRWVIRETTDYLDDPNFDEAVKSSTGPSQSLKEDNTTSQSDSQMPTKESSNKSAEKQNEKADVSEDVSGRWIFDLHQSLGSSLDLILIQSGDRLQGYGTLMENGAKTAATATGSIAKDSLSLDVKSVINSTNSSASKKYEMKLQAMNDMLLGHYDLFLSDELAGEGNATAKRSG